MMSRTVLHPAFRTILAWGACALLVACDVVNDPHGDVSGPTPPTTDGVPRRVLLEKFTGHTCPNCPEGDVIASELQAQYGSELLILTSIHQGFFAELHPPLYDTDFTTPAGNDYGSIFTPPSYPQGMVDRRRVNNTWTFGRGDWDERIAEVIGQPAKVDVRITAAEVNSGAINTSVKVKLIEELDPVEYNLTVFLQESGIIDYQTDQNATPPDVPNYEHNHILRGALNGSWGQPFAMTDLAVGDSTTVDLTNLAIPSNVLNISNCELVAYLYRNDTYEILQVHAHHVE